MRAAHHLHKGSEGRSAVAKTPGKRTNLSDLPVVTASSYVRAKLNALNEDYRKRVDAHEQLVRRSGALDYAGARTAFPEAEAAFPPFDLLRRAQGHLLEAETHFSKGQADFASQAATAADDIMKEYDEIWATYLSGVTRGKQMVRDRATMAAGMTLALTPGVGPVGAGLFGAAGAMWTNANLQLHESSHDHTVIVWNDFLLELANSGVAYGLPVFAWMKLSQLFRTRLPAYLGDNVPETTLVSLGRALGGSEPIPRDLFVAGMHKVFADFSAGVLAAGVTACIEYALDRLRTEGHMTSQSFVELVGERLLQTAIMQIVFFGIIKGVFALRHHDATLKLPKEVPWWDDGQVPIPGGGLEPNWREKTASFANPLANEQRDGLKYLQAYGERNFDPEYLPIYQQFLDHRAQHPIGPVGRRDQAIDATSQMDMVKWMHNAIKEKFEGVDPNAPGAVAAKVLLERTAAMMNEGRFTLWDLNIVFNVYMRAMSEGGRIRQTLDQRPPSQYIVGFFNVDHGNAGTAVDKTSTGLTNIPLPVAKFSGAVPPAEFSGHDIGHKNGLASHPSGPGRNRGSSFIHDLPRQVRQAHFKETLYEAFPSGDDAIRVRALYQALTHEHEALPLPEHLVAYSPITGFTLEKMQESVEPLGLSVTTAQMEVAGQTLKSFARRYVSLMPDGARRLVEAEFTLALQQVNVLPGRYILSDIQELTNSVAPSIQDYQLFLRDPAFRKRKLEGGYSDEEYDSVCRFVDDWAKKAKVEGPHPSDMARSIILEKRPR